ncbi:hypothetical protein D3C80_1661920 [compost metagenome]
MRLVDSLAVAVQNRHKRELLIDHAVNKLLNPAHFYINNQYSLRAERQRHRFINSKHTYRSTLYQFRFVGADRLPAFRQRAGGDLSDPVLVYKAGEIL